MRMRSKQELQKHPYHTKYIVFLSTSFSSSGPLHKILVEGPCLLVSLNIPSDVPL